MEFNQEKIEAAREAIFTGPDPEELCPSCYQEDYAPTPASGAGADVERAREAAEAWSKKRGGFLIRNTDDCVWGFEQGYLAALASSTEQRLREALETCRDQFAAYAEMHRAKLADTNLPAALDGIMDKVNRNRDMADMCRQALERNQS